MQNSVGVDTHTDTHTNGRSYLQTALQVFHTHAARREPGGGSAG